ncbi:hypothetical protein SprV_0100429500 [Sparganum proliferum]
MEETGPTPTYMKCTNFMEESLCLAAAEGKLNKMIRILQERVDPDCRNGVGYTPLHLAAQAGQFEAVKLLLCNWASPDPLNASKVSPLHLAAKNDHYKVAQLLILVGADPGRACWSGCTPREFAPFDSATQHMIEQCLKGEYPDPLEVFEMKGEPLVPAFSIPEPDPDTKKKASPKKEGAKAKK